jgi:type I restriction enzyme S subunit
MNAPLLTEEFHLLAAAPNGVQKLRKLILELAVRGKLVPQDPNDEPASELLRRIAKERIRLEAEGACKKSKATPLGATNAPPFELPAGWALSQLSDLTLVLNGRAYSKDELLSEGVPVLRVGNLFTSNHWYYSNLQLEDDKYCDQGDLLYSWSASFGPFIWQGPKVIYHYHIWKLRLFDELSLSKEFLYKFLLEKTAEIKAAGHGVSMIHMTKEKMEKILVPVPPFAEQHRIVAKVDELMTLCDQLEAQQTTQTEAHERLVAALLGDLTQSADAAAFADNWARIGEYFDLLFDTPESIDNLKQSVLQLAVQGKLVEQDANDESASELLKRIEAEKVKLVAAGKIKRGKPLNPISDSEKPFCLPPYWCWVRVDDLLPSFQNGASSRGDPNGVAVNVLRLADIKKGVVSLDDLRSLPIASIDIEKYKLSNNDILILRVNGSTDLVGRFVPIETAIPAIYCDHFIRLRVSTSFIYHRYLVLAASSKFVRNRIGDLFVTTAGQKTVNQQHVGSLLLSLPPVAEQHRIVTKVDELMAVCDALAARLKAARDLSSTLVTAAADAALS